MKTTAGTLSLGIIGCGNVTESFHLPILKSLYNVNIFALSDLDTKKLNKLAHRFEIKNCYEDPYELINHPNIQAVAVCAPTERHFSLGMAALSAGKHLFMEKPIAMSPEEGEKLIKKAEISSVKAFVGFNLRWHRNVRKVKETLEKGKLGPIRLVRSVMTTNDSSHSGWRKTRALGGGAILDLAIHHFDLLRYLFNSEVEEIYANSASGDIQDEAAQITLKLTNGVLSSSIYSFVSSHSNEIEIYGYCGSVKISFYDIDGLEIRSSSVLPGRLISIISRAFQKAIQIANNARVLSHGGIFKESYYREWQSFVDSVVHDKDVECTLEDGWYALKIAHAALQAVITGKPVKVCTNPINRD